MTETPAQRLLDDLQNAEVTDWVDLVMHLGLLAMLGASSYGMGYLAAAKEYGDAFELAATGQVTPTWVNQVAIAGMIVIMLAAVGNVYLRQVREA